MTLGKFLPAQSGTSSHVEKVAGEKGWKRKPGRWCRGSVHTLSPDSLAIPGGQGWLDLFFFFFFGGLHSFG